MNLRTAREVGARVGARWSVTWRRAASSSAARRAGRRALGVVAALVVGWIAIGLTPPRWWIDETRFARPDDAFAVVDRDGHVLRRARVDGVDRRWVALRDVDPDLQGAFIAAEDARFRAHDGVDELALLRAALTAVRPWGRKSGGSTITQQVVKLTYGRPYGIFSKPLELVRARALERLLTKDEILEQYVNRVPYGDRIEGVARASEAYFGHDVADVSLAEAAMLAGIPQAPSATEPRRHLERARRRATYVLSRMRETAVIDDDAWARATASPAAVVDASTRPYEAPRFVDAALSAWRHGALDRDGPRLRTSLDLTLQRTTDEATRGAVARFASRGVANGAALVVANATGEVLAYTGAARRDAPGGSLDLLARKRQPGSTLKPFAYELFFERGGTAATVLDDIAIARTGARGASFEAEDYDGRERGPVRARVALAASLNLAALDVAARVGQDAFVDRLRRLGFRDVGDASRYGGAAVLGGLDVTPLDLAAAYVALARGGTKVPLSLRPAVPAPGARVMSEAAAAVARDVLRDGAARAAAFGDDLEREAGGAPFALKTGTSSGWRDAWSVAFDDDFTALVWLGDPDGRPLGGVSGFEAAAPVAARLLGAARARGASLRAVAPTSSPPRLVTASVCADTGLRPGAGCRHVLHERFARGTVPDVTCEAHDEHGDVQLPARYADWIARHRPAGVATSLLGPSAAALDADAKVEVREPRDGARLLLAVAKGETFVPLRARVAGAEVEAAQVQWRVDGRTVDGDRWALRPGDHELVAVWRGHASRPARVRVETTGSR